MMAAFAHGLLFLGDEAMTSFELHKSAWQEREVADVYAQWSLVLLDAKRLRDAERFAKESLGCSQHSRGAYATLGIIAVSKRDFDQASQHLSKLANGSPEEKAQYTQALKKAQQLFPAATKAFTTGRNRPSQAKAN